jgi:hypothetical protein
VVGDFDSVGTAIVAAEADSVRVIDPDTELIDFAALQILQPLAGRDGEFSNPANTVAGERGSGGLGRSSVN